VNRIHKTAVVDPGAELGDDVRVGPFAVVEADVRIGAGTVIGPHASILRFTTIGELCEIHAGAVLGDSPQDTAFTECESYVRIGSNCRVREGVTIHRGTDPESATEVGDGCFLMAFSHLAHNVCLGREVVLANGALLGGHVRVGERAFISGHCLVHQFVRIGRVAMLGGGSGVSKDVPPFCTVRTLVFNRVVGLNVVGLRRAGLEPPERAALKKAFRILYRSGRNVSEAVSEIRKSVASPAAMEFCEFVESSERGICGPEG
jgi:UDP-N-acetylglucosamine acyltransferase